MTTRILDEDDLAALALGCGILGTGGGTHPYLEYLNLLKLHRAGRVLRLVTIDELADDAWVAEVGYMGAPLATKERLPDSAHAARPAAMMQEFLGLTFSAVMSSEIGAENGLLQFMVAAELGLPVLDADTMGRAFPELQMSSLVFAGLPLHPMALADIRDNEVMLTEGENPIWVERMGRRLCTEMGSIAATCRPPRRASDVRAHGLLGSVSRALALGHAVIAAQRGLRDAAETIAAAAGGTLLFRGKVVDVARVTAGGFGRGHAALEGLEAFEGQTLSVEFQNEWTICRIDGALVRTVPDLVCLVETDTGEAIGTETIRYGLRVSVVALPANPALTTPQALAYVGPRAFGYDLDYVPPAGVSATARPG
jgi:hypothetical protein